MYVALDDSRNRAYILMSSQARKSSQASDDDAFLIPSDSSMPASASSHRRSSSGSSVRASSRRSSAVDSDSDSFIVPDSDTEVGDAPKKSNAKASKSKASRPALQQNVSSAGGSGYSFLTAAEQREQGKKDDKKSTEDPYSFLLNIMDVCTSVITAIYSSESDAAPPYAERWSGTWRSRL